MNYNNLAQSTNFIAGSIKFKNIPFFLTEVNIPGLAINHPEVGGRSSTSLNLTGDTVNFNSLQFDMLIDEDFIIYQEITDIINSNIDCKTGTFTDDYFDFFIELNNNKGNKILKLDFYNCRVANISDIQLSTQDSSTEYKMSMELVFDYFEIEKKPSFILQECKKEIEFLLAQNQENYTEEFNDQNVLDNEYQIWGLSQPTLDDIGISFSKGTNENGVVLNSIPIDAHKPFVVTFIAKQEISQSTESSDNEYLDFGITEGVGISSTTNGRTGNTISGFKVSNNVIYTVNAKTDIAKSINDGEFHEYKIEYNTDGIENSKYTLYIDDVFIKEYITNIPVHDTLFIYAQGKSPANYQVIDKINIVYNKKV